MNVGYVRLSRDDDKRNYVSIENQKLIISQFAAECNMVIDRWYEDDGVSGYIFNRPGLNQLMDDLDKDIDRVFVKDLSRVGRHNAKVLLLLEDFKERKKELIVVDTNYNSETDDDDTIGITTWYNEKYVKDSVLGNREESKNKIKKGLIIGLGVYAIWVLLAIVFLVVVVVLIFNHARKTNEQIFGLFGNVVEQVNGETQSTENSENQMEEMQNVVNSMRNMMD